MKGGAVVLLAILLGVFLAVGQCGSGSADEKDDDSHSSSSASDDHDEEQASDDDDGDSDDDKKSDDDDKKRDNDNNNKNSGDDDSGSSLAEAMKQQLESDGLQVRQMSTAENDDCAANSYGECATTSPATRARACNAPGTRSATTRTTRRCSRWPGSRCPTRRPPTT
jgi:hypothetical protein